MKQPQTVSTVSQPSAATPSALVALLWCALGLLIPRATLYGEMAPFGIGLAAAVATNRLPMLLSLSVGYLLADPVLLPLRYIATVAVVGGARWVLAAMPDLDKHPLVPPLVSFVSTIATGLVILGQSGLDGYRTLLIIAEAAVAAGCSMVFSTAMTWSRQSHTTETLPAHSSPKQAALILAGAILLMAASTLEVKGFAPGRVAAGFLVLALARSGREPGGCMAGVILGAAVALSQPGQTAPAVALAFGGLLAGLFSRLGRLLQAGAFLLAAGIVTLAEMDDTMLIHMYEFFCAAVLFALLPKSAERRLSRLFIQHSEHFAAEGIRRLLTMRLQVAASAMEEVSDALTVVTQRLSQHAAPDTQTIYHRCRDAVCSTCPLWTLCWEQHGTELLAGLEQTSHLLKEQGNIQPEQLTGYPKQQCRHPRRLTDYINHAYHHSIAQKSAWNRLQEIQSAVQEQFRGTGYLLQDMAGYLNDPQQVDIELSARVLTVCRDFGMPIQDALCTRTGGNRLTVDILTQDDVGVSLKQGRWLREIHRVCDRDFAPPTTGEWGDFLRITLRERPRYTVEIGITQRPCTGEKLCGDAVNVFTADGRTVAILSDGMGSGGRAAVDSAMTAGITSRLWKAGFSPASILQTVNAALLVKSREESLSTLDILTIDTGSGRLESYKAGGTASLLRSGGRVSRLERPSLPIGILPDVPFECSHDWLVAGDILLLMSDGALAGGLASIEDLLRAHREEDSMQQLADTIVAAAQVASEDHPDDISVVALRLHRTTEES
ncbi:MAG: SpoIIE family protein phosphatase [Clostridia bacterium]|nr:SpoIIE family protein phosphatase [Clostridia bacterium]